MRTRGTISTALAIVSAASACLSAEAQQQASVQVSGDSEYLKLDRLLSLIRARNTEEFSIRSVDGIDEAGYVSIGGIEQWITIRGQDRANPVLLFLHGGPGDVTNPWSFALFSAWEEHFTVVQWDQRGAGRTLKRTGPGIAPTMTLDRMVQDGVEVAEYLQMHLHKKKTRRSSLLRINRRSEDGIGKTGSVLCIRRHWAGG
jgi:predicted alpha/beta-fold hydrolase